MTAFLQCPEKKEAEEQDTDLVWAKVRINMKVLKDQYIGFCYRPPDNHGIVFLGAVTDTQ